MRGDTILIPASLADIQDAVADAARRSSPLEIRGRGSKAEIGAPNRETTVLSMAGFSDVIEYEPSELVLTVGAGMPLERVQALIAEHGQMLAFEPFDHGPIFGRAAGAATIGGVIAASVSGSRRVSAGAVRDHVLGFEAVSGRGERFVGGARVVKNVTGYDLPKLMTGSWGQLVVLTQVTLKVLPRPREAKTIAVSGLNDERAVRAMCAAMGSQAEVAAAACVQPVTAFRLEGFGPSVAARAEMLQLVLADFGGVDVLSDEDAAAFWQSVRDVTPLSDGSPLWRINVPATEAPGVTAALRDLGASWYYDWAGALIWLTMPGGDGDANAAMSAIPAGDAASMVAGSRATSASGAGNATSASNASVSAASVGSARGAGASSAAASAAADGVARSAAAVRRAAEKAGGHAVLVRANASMRAAVPALHPEPAGVAALARRIKAAFDPANILDPARF